MMKQTHNLTVLSCGGTVTIQFVEGSPISWEFMDNLNGKLAYHYLLELKGDSSPEEFLSIVMRDPNVKAE
jgi:hypothetical protein